MSDVALTHEELASRLETWEKNSTRKNWIIVILSVALVFALTGWWFTSRDQSATKRNGSRADCRGIELATDLDQFKIIVGPGASKEEKRKGRQTSRDARQPCTPL